MEKYHIPNDSVEETLVIPLYGRLIAEERYPSLKGKRDTKRVVDALDYDFEGKRKKMTSVGGLYGALECVQREYDLACEAKEYLSSHPKAAVVFDCPSSKGVAYANAYLKKTGNEGALIHFYVDEAEDFASEAKATLLGAQTFYEKTRKVLKTGLSLYTRLAMIVVDKKGLGKVIHIVL